MGFGKGSKLLPVSDLVIRTPMLTYFGSEVPRLSFTLQPQINGVAANVKMLAGFTALHAIEFDRLYDFLAQVVAVGFGHDRNGSKSGRAFLFYVLTLMATAIYSGSRLSEVHFTRRKAEGSHNETSFTTVHENIFLPLLPLPPLLFQVRRGDCNLLLGILSTRDFVLCPLPWRDYSYSTASCQRLKKSFC